MRLSRLVLVLALVAAAALVFTRWPRINQVEAGRTPEYPQLREREFAASEAAVAKAVNAAVASLPNWTLVGSGQGRGGTAVQAVAKNPAQLKTEMTISVRRQGAKTVVRALARSTFGPWDFGQGARHIEDFHAALDRQMAGGPAKP
jgi:hypothetical protein